MSLVRQLIQIALVEACRGQTLALNAVFDSRMDTLDGLMVGERRPVLIFSIEESESRRVDQTDGLFGRSPRFTVMVQAAVASGEEIVDDNGTIILPAIGETDAALEAQLNLLDWQWRAALTRVGGAWAELFRSLITGIGQIKDQRATDPQTGTKHAARFTQFELDAMPDPLPGDVVPEIIEGGLALLEQDPEYAILANTWRQILVADLSLDDVRRLQIGLFSTTSVLLALGAGGLAAPAEGGPGDGTLTTVSLSIPGISPIDTVAADDP